MEGALSEKIYAKNNHGFIPWLFVLRLVQTISNDREYFGCWSLPSNFHKQFIKQPEEIRTSVI
ncbi:hypothetical protein ABH897_003844 [Paenibacillus sp. RC73]|uniref:Uncharacterized protein n=1 Tax=Paenibacillus terrae TaxID=159743 RepID=A0A0D7X3X2_9BACL|nr:hypothetical protein QD47_08110 [Paenibacillus terrae]